MEGKRWKFRDDILGYYINGVSSMTFQDAENRLNYFESREEEKKNITLTEEEIDCFNAYIQDAKMDIAFGNTDWCKIYHKIVGDKVSDYAKEKMDLYHS